MMEPTLDFSTSSFAQFDHATLNRTDLLFVGDAVDDRGVEAISRLDNFANQKIKLNYVADRNSIIIDGVAGQFGALITLCRGKSVRIETTTLGLAEIIKATQACREAGVSRIEFVYVEPKNYSLRKPVADGYFDPRDFELTTNRTFSAVHGFTHEHSDRTKEHFIFFLGFESSRLMQAVSQQEHDIDNKYAVIGVPPFQAGWETNSLASHVHDLESLGFDGNSVRYCAANSAREAYLTLWNLYKNLGKDDAILIVSPLGTKPHAVGAALFLIETKGHLFETALYYDHPERTKERSKKIGTWHFCEVKWQ